MIRLLALALLATPANAGEWTVTIRSDPVSARAPCPKPPKLSGWPDPVTTTTPKDTADVAAGYLYLLQTCGFITRAQFNAAKSIIGVTKFVPACTRADRKNPWQFGTADNYVEVTYWGPECPA